MENGLTTKSDASIKRSTVKERDLTTGRENAAAKIGRYKAYF